MMKKIFTVISVTLFLGMIFTGFSPSFDGRAVVAENGELPEGLFGKTVGYLPGDSVSVVNPANNASVNILVLGSLDPSEGVAILLTPEAAKELKIEGKENNLVKLTKRTGKLDEQVFGSATIAQPLTTETETAPEPELAIDPIEPEVTMPEEVAAIDETPSEITEPVEEVETPVDAVAEVVEPTEELAPVEEIEAPVEAVAEVVEPTEELAPVEEVETPVEAVAEVVEPTEELAPVEEIEAPVEAVAEVVEPTEELAPVEEEAPVEVAEVVKPTEELAPVEEIETPVEVAEVPAPAAVVVEEVESEENILSPNDELVVAENFPKEPENLEESVELEELPNHKVEDEAVELEEIPAPAAVVAEDVVQEESLPVVIAEAPAETENPVEVEQPVEVEESPVVTEVYSDEVEPNEEKESFETIIADEPEVELAQADESYAPIVLVPSDSNPPVVEDVKEVEKEEFVPSVAEIIVPKEEKSIISDNSDLSEYIVPNIQSLQSGKYYIQISVLKDTANIQNIFNTYKAQYPLVMVPLSNGSANQLLVGPLERDEYGSVLQKFKAQGFKDAFLRKIR